VLGFTNLQNIARIRLMLDLQDNTDISDKDFMMSRLDEIISTNSLSASHSLYMVRDQSNKLIENAIQS
jgi:gamma-glutamylcysteine synthetase